MIDLTDYKAVIFDLDGTLIDSMWIWYDIDVAYLKRHGHRTPAGLQRAIEGMSPDEVAVYFKRQFGIADSVAAIKDEWFEMARDYYANQIGLKKGARQLLEQLRQGNVKIALATSNWRELTELVLAANGVADYFTVLRTAADFGRGKNHTDIFVGVAAELGVAPAECLVFEDTTVAAATARRAGMDVIAIADVQSKLYRAELTELALHYLEDFTVLLK